MDLCKNGTFGNSKKKIEIKIVPSESKREYQQSSCTKKKQQ